MSNSTACPKDTDLYQSLAASVYDRFPAPDFTYLLALIESLRPEKGLAFDVGCGTGTLLKHLMACGWEASGCDPSEAMVNMAREKNPGVGIQSSTAATFTASRPLDLITSTFDVMNHLPNLNAVRGFFERCSGALSDNGLLIFDTVTPNDIRQNWPRYAHIESRPDKLIAIRGEKIDSYTGRLHYDFFVARADGSYMRASEIHTLRVLPLAWTIKALRRAGFSEVLHLDAMNLEKPSKKTVRWIFAASKKPRPANLAKPGTGYITQPK